VELSSCTQFKDISTVVHGQKEQLDVLESNMAAVESTVRNGAKLLQEADQLMLAALLLLLFALRVQRLSIFGGHRYKSTIIGKARKNEVLS
jgi:hypothetical protein